MGDFPTVFWKKRIGLVTVAFAVLIFSASTRALAPGDTHPVTNRGRPWRIGYYEGGSYVNYPANLASLARGLTKLGWMEPVVLSEANAPGDSKIFWEALSRSSGPYLQFVPQAFWSAQWDETLRVRNRSDTIRRLREKQLDFIIAMGTWAGQDLADNQHSVPTMVVSSSNPVQAGIARGAMHSGLDHVHARCDPNRYLRQVRLFHDIFAFKHLGVVYENSQEGRSYAAMADLEKVAVQRGFELVACEAPWSGLTLRECTRNLIACHQRLAPRIDALFLTVHRGVDGARMDDILRPLIDHRIPTWSQRGPEEVRQGVLMSIARDGFESIGRYHARIMARILNGARPGDLNQIFEDPKGIAINLKTAAAIGYKPPKGLMQVADEIYQ